MSVTAAIRKMLDKGLTVEQALIAAEAFESEPPALTARQARNKRYYDEHKRLNASEQDAQDDKVSPKKEIPPTPPKEKTTPSNSKAKAFSEREEKFAEFWIAYPRREGSNPRKPAKARFDRLVASGTDPQRIIDAAKALAVEHPTPTRFVPQALTWLNQDRWDDEAPLLSGNEFCPTDWIATRFLVARFRNENQTDPPPAIHGGKSGYMLPAEWVAIAKQRQESNGTRLEN